MKISWTIHLLFTFSFAFCTLVHRLENIKTDTRRLDNHVLHDTWLTTRQGPSKSHQQKMNEYMANKKQKEELFNTGMTLLDFLKWSTRQHIIVLHSSYHYNAFSIESSWKNLARNTRYWQYAMGKKRLEQVHRDFQTKLPIVIEYPKMGVRKGLNFDACNKQKDCLGNRECVQLRGGSLVECPIDGSECRCFATENDSCTTDTECDEGESCKELGGRDTCISNEAELASINRSELLPGDGLNLDLCSDTDGCAGSRVCAQPSGGSLIACPNDGSDCRCFAIEDHYCTADADCDKGESCTGTGGREICVSSTLEFETSKPSEQPHGDGLNWDSCSDTQGCAGNRMCAQSSAGLFSACRNDGPLCVCVPLEDYSCTTDTECDRGEICAGPGGRDKCISNEVVIAGNTPLRQPPGDGLNLDLCSYDEGCAGSRGCAQLSEDTLVACPNDGSDCRCFATEDDSCTTDSDCDEGESCKWFEGRNQDICISNEFELLSNRPPEQPHGDGLNGDFCSDTNGCAGSRACVQLSTAFLVACRNDGPLCICFPTEDASCTTDTECDEGEKCAVLGGKDECISNKLKASGDEPDQPQTPGEDTETDPPLSPSPEENVSPEEEVTSEGVCIDAEALKHLNESDLVFDHHNLAIVMCDKSESCATAGHMVIWNGRGMMMKQYCAMSGGCEKKILRVNSPIWKMRARIQSRTSGLEYTAFAARYETGIEEMLLRTVIYAGL